MRDVQRLFTGLATAATFSAFAVGCGSEPAPLPQQTVETPAATTVSETAQVTTADQPSGTKWLGKVPYDVFYDRPLDKVGAAQELGATAVVAAVPQPPATGMTPAAPDATTPETTDAATSSTGSWSSLIDAEVLDAESKLIRTRLTANLQSVSTYNRSIDAVTSDAIIMAALAGVAEQYDADMRWKERAPAVRTLAYQVYENAGANGRKAFTATQLPFEQMIAILDGGPTDDVDAELNAPFADYADRSAIMERVDQTSNWLKSTIVSDALLKQNQEETIREASVLAMIGGMIKTDSYDYHDEENYQKYAADFTTASTDARDAAAELNFVSFQDALSRLQNSCATCHGEYAFGDDGL